MSISEKAQAAIELLSSDYEKERDRKRDEDIKEKEATILILRSRMSLIKLAMWKAYRTAATDPDLAREVLSEAIDKANDTLRGEDAVEEAE